MYQEIIFGMVCFTLGLIAGPLFLFICFKLAMKVLRRAQKR